MVFCHPLFCHSSFVKHTSSLLQQWSRYETSLTIITEIAPPQPYWLDPLLVWRYCVKSLFGKQQRSQLCVTCEKTRPNFDARIKRFLNVWYIVLLNCDSSLKDRIVWPTRNGHFWPTKANHFCVIPKNPTIPDCRKQRGYESLNKWILFGSSPMSLTVPRNAWSVLHILLQLWKHLLHFADFKHLWFSSTELCTKHKRTVVDHAMKLNIPIWQRSIYLKTMLKVMLIISMSTTGMKAFMHRPTFKQFDLIYRFAQTYLVVNRNKPYYLHCSFWPISSV